MKWILFLTLAFSSTVFAQTKFARTNDLALVYKGPGSCPEDCSESAAHVAELAGLTPVYVGPQDFRPQLFSQAKIWIQPGGHSTDVAKAMAPELKQAIREFVQHGGAYVGFCAGGFFAGETFHDETEIGLGLIPGQSLYEQSLDQYQDGVVIDISWLGRLRSVYWEGGPYFVLRSPNAFTVTAYYPNGHVAGLRGPFGQGRVAVTGFHPEAPMWWRKNVPGTDVDGLDEDIAVQMIHWTVEQ